MRALLVLLLPALLLVGTLALGLRALVLRPAAVERLSRTTITYRECALERHRRSTQITLAGEAGRYRIDRSLWRGRLEDEDLWRALRAQHEATVWLWSPGSHLVMGIAAGPVFIDPRVGVEVQNHGRAALLWTAAACYAGAALVLLALRTSRPVESAA